METLALDGDTGSGRRHWLWTETDGDICTEQRQLETFAQDRESWRQWLRTETAGDTDSGQRQLETLTQDRDSWRH